MSRGPCGGRSARGDLILYADAARFQAEPPVRFAARLPRVQEFENRTAETFPPPSHVQDLLCAGDAADRVKEVSTVQVEWVKGADGKLGPREIPGTERALPAGLVLLALGFVGPERAGLLTDLGVELDGRGNVWTDEEQMTSVPGLFAAGDCSRGQSLVV